MEALQEALARYGKPEIFNTDEARQFTSEAFTTVLAKPKVSALAWTAEGVVTTTSTLDSGYFE